MPTALRDAGEVRALTGMRGVAAVVVMIYHFSEQHLGGGLFKVALDRGYLMVDLFFVLSGAISARRYGPALRQGGSVAAFFTRRLARLWPVYLVCLAAALVLARLGAVDVPFERQGPAAVLANAMMVQGWGLAGSFDAPAWSASVEWAACLLFPVLAPACLFRSRGVAAAVGLAALSVLCGLSMMPTGWLQQALRGGGLDLYEAATPAPLLRGVCGFVIGMLAFRLSGLVAGRGAGVAAAVLIAGLALAAPDVAVVLIAAVLVAALLQSRGGLARALGSRAPRWVGERSYPLYLVHFLLLPVMRAGSGFFLGTGVPDAALLALCVTSAFALLIAHWLHVLVERPFRVMPSRLVGRVLWPGVQRMRS